MQSATVTAACPECGQPATLSMHSLEDDRFVFEFTCRNGHDVTAAQAEQLWITAHE